MDGGYAGDKLKDALAATVGPSIEIVRRPAGVTGFVVVARPLSWFEGKPLPGSGWVVERTFAWLGPLSADCFAIACRAMVADGWQRTGKHPSHQRMPGSSSLPSEDQHASSQEKPLRSYESDSE